LIDLKKLEADFENISKSLAKKKVGKEFLENLRKLFIDRKANNKLIEENKSEQNKYSKLFGEYKKEGKDITELKGKITLLKNEAIPFITQKKLLDETMEKFNLYVPNIPNDIVPEGDNEDDNIEIRKVLEPKIFNFKVKNHWELENGWLDFKRGAKLAGSRFTILRGDAAKLERA